MSARTLLRNILTYRHRRRDRRIEAENAAAWAAWWASRTESERERMRLGAERLAYFVSLNLIDLKPKDGAE